MTGDFIDRAPSARPCSRGTMSFEDGYFSFAEPLPARAEALSSSGRKYVYRGTHVRLAGDREVRMPACAVFFAGRDAEIAYARERTGLVMGSALGVGPRPLELDAWRRLPDATEDESPLALIVEEDVGVSLEGALLGAPVPCFEEGHEQTGEPLPRPDTPEGAAAARKILFDVLSQVCALQQQGLFHRDLRSANIALRSWGPGAEGMRATLLDLEFLTDRPRGGVRFQGYYDRLFGARGLLGLGRDPTPLEQDVGYLALVAAEVLNGQPAERLDDEAILAVLRGGGGPLSLGSGGILARRVAERDLRRQAHLAGLATTRDVYGAVSERAVSIADQVARHAGYVDLLDRMRIEGDVDMILERGTIERIAHAIWRNYAEHRLRDGLELEYESYEAQPDDLKESCLDQARSLRDKVELLGYAVVPAEECDEAHRVRALDESQVELLAQEEHARWVDERLRSGWSYGPEKDVERKVSPYLVDWDELDDGIREYDREPVREMIGLIESVGLVVRR